MGCLIFLFSLIGPRFALGFVWIFTDFVDRAFDNNAVPAVGFVFLPWTTLIYALAHNGNEVSPIGWFFVALGFFSDMSSYALSARQSRRRGYV